VGAASAGELAEVPDGLMGLTHWGAKCIDIWVEKVSGVTLKIGIVRGEFVRGNYASIACSRHSTETYGETQESIDAFLEGFISFPHAST
jgi:hypothetical protein